MVFGDAQGAGIFLCSYGLLLTPMRSGPILWDLNRVHGILQLCIFVLMPHLLGSTTTTNRCICVSIVQRRAVVVTGSLLVVTGKLETGKPVERVRRIHSWVLVDWNVKVAGS